MKQLATVLSLLFAIACVSRVSHAQSNSPKQVVEDFCKFETAGGLLAPDGWNKLNKFLATPVSPTKAQIIFVTDAHYSVWDPVIKNDKATVIVGTGDIWKLDSRMRLVPDLSQKSVKSGFAYQLILTDKHWELGQDEKLPKEVAGPREWKIVAEGKNMSNTIWLTADTAIRYVTQVRDETKDAVVRQNTTKTVTRLKRLLR